METVLFGVVPVLVFMGLAVRSALRGRSASARYGQDGHEWDGRERYVSDEARGVDADAPGYGVPGYGVPEYRGPEYGRAEARRAFRPGMIDPT